MMPSMRGLLVLALMVSTTTAGTAVLMPSAQAQAQEPEVEIIGQSRDWTAYRFEEDGTPVCYMASQPQKDEGNYTKRGEIFALITHRPEERNVVSIIAGYTYKQGSEVTVSIDNTETFNLFTYRDTAWAYDGGDAELVAAMKAGRSMVVKGTSSRGTLTTDTYSLMGFTATHQQIGEACP